MSIENDFVRVQQRLFGKSTSAFFNEARSVADDMFRFLSDILNCRIASNVNVSLSGSASFFMHSKANY